MAASYGSRVFYRKRRTACKQSSLAKVGWVGPPFARGALACRGGDELSCRESGTTRAAGRVMTPEALVKDEVDAIAWEIEAEKPPRLRGPCGDR